MTEPSACTVEVGSTDDFDNIHIPGFEGVPTITVTSADVPRGVPVYDIEPVLEEIGRLIDLGIPMDPHDVLRRIGMSASRKRPRRSRQNRSRRPRAARRLDTRTLGEHR